MTDGNGNGRRLVGSLAGPAFTVIAGLAAGAVGVWAQSEVTQSEIADHDRRIQTLEQTERAHILATLEKTRWKLSGPSGAAVRLGLNRSTLQSRMKKLGILRPI